MQEAEKFTAVLNPDTFPEPEIDVLTVNVAEEELPN
jgi:hypothetical protein